jgi:16S rRNA (cytidine1402-2'-O)-methyltransferase
MSTNLSLSHREQEPENGVLYLVGTPIGNLSDISSRALNILKNVFLILCEDTRETRKILSRFKIQNELSSFNRHNSNSKIPKIIKYLKSGKSLALVSDAGMPLICDPGEDLVQNAKLHDLEIICIPGPCAAITALAVSGLPCSKFVFEGFLPRKKIEREKNLLEISKNEKTTIIYESPRRLKQLLFELKEYCGGSREIAVSRELTKKFEQHIGNNIDNVIKFFEDNQIIGEFTLVIKGIERNQNFEIDKNAIRRELRELVEAGLSLSSASKYLAKKKNITKKIIYNLY